MLVFMLSLAMLVAANVAVRRAQRDDDYLGPVPLFAGT
jgi:hypothetical protein